MSITNRNGFILRFPFSPKSKRINEFRINFLDFCVQKVKEGHFLGYNCFILELVEDDFKILDFTMNDKKKTLKDFLKETNTRIAIYIKSKKFLTSDDPDDVEIALSELEKGLHFSMGISDIPQELPVILHIGGAKGDRKSTMERFCGVLQENFSAEQISRIAVINDDKPSLFSVKDLLPGVFYKLKLPIIFRSTSYPTNQGNLTRNESLFLSASTWNRSVNPIFIYLPGGEELDESQTSPFGLQLDIVFDNKLPEPR
jgi:UV DNA damage repair endonuclease